MSKPFSMNYRRDPDGPSDPGQWRTAFRQRLGLDAARAAVGGNDPYEILGVSRGSSWAEIKSAYRKLVLKSHPDRPDGNAAEFRRVQGAFEILEDRQ